jgi:hypothetical protein
LFVVATEMLRVFVADPVARVARVEGLVEHQPLGERLVAGSEPLPLPNDWHRRVMDVDQFPPLGRPREYLRLATLRIQPRAVVRERRP